MSPHATNTVDEHQSPNIPVIDLASYNSAGSLEERRAVGKKLVQACRNGGFVYIINHGVPQGTLDQAFAVSKKFYDLPREDKLKAPHPPGWEIHRGYSWPGLEKVSVAMSDGVNDQAAVEKLRVVQDYKESYEIGSDDHQEQPNVWVPNDVFPEFRPFMTSFYWTCFEAASNILRALALGIGLENENDLVKLHSGHYNQLRLLHYPPIPAQAIEGGQFVRMPAHCDWSTITILFQDNCGGLQVEDPKQPGAFYDVEPLPGSLVMNIGDLMMRWSNDMLRSTSHRVNLPPLQDRFTGDSRLTRARYSIPYFLTTDPDLLIECMPPCVDDVHPAKYQPITQRAYNKMKASMQY